jgi:hypothetical protein
MRPLPAITSVRPSSGNPVMTLPVRCQTVLAVPDLMTVAIPAPGCRRGSAGQSRDLPPAAADGREAKVSVHDSPP